jgi:hypothetical protein
VTIKPYREIADIDGHDRRVIITSKARPAMRSSMKLLIYCFLTTFFFCIALKAF